MIGRSIVYSELDSVESGCVFLKVLSCEMGHFVAWLVYKPAYLGMVSSAAACVTLDCRPKRMKNGLKSRLQCRKCPERIGNVSMCSHVDFVVFTVLVDNNAATEQDMNALEMLQNGEFVVISDADEPDPMVPETFDGDEYLSSMDCNVFASKTEDLFCVVL